MAYHTGHNVQHEIPDARPLNVQKQAPKVAMTIRIDRTSDSNTIDRRVARKRALLQDALIALIPEHAYAAITVDDICQRANVGRSTFYTHYADKDALRSATIEAHLGSLSRGRMSAGQEIGARLFAFSLPMFEHALAFRSLHHALLASSGDTIYDELRERIRRAPFEQNLSKSGSVEVECPSNSPSSSSRAHFLRSSPGGSPPTRTFRRRKRMISSRGLRETVSAVGKDQAPIRRTGLALAAADVAPDSGRQEYLLIGLDLPKCRWREAPLQRLAPERIRVKVGETLKVRFIGTERLHPPMHIHGGPFEVVARDGETISLRPASLPTPLMSGRAVVGATLPSMASPPRRSPPRYRARATQSPPSPRSGGRAATASRRRRPASKAASRRGS